ncbi:hypothetical protein I4F81_010278 [Pyropia yezoensis]|uniref:Uncharacterized protein n=1 Tax=Pyropia yezoensis TaxID=2788 RepID=A0ACC3CD69_PYRYE|nr:hypothetical protein I4F81_010278 [Neopyropia yezoensis]
MDGQRRRLSRPGSAAAVGAADAGGLVPSRFLGLSSQDLRVYYGLALLLLAFAFTGWLSTATNQSGSTALLSEMTQHSDIMGSPTGPEPIDHYEYETNTSLALAWTRQFLAEGIAAGKVPGFKLRPTHILADPDGFRALVREFGVRVIWNSRANLLKQAVGEYRGRYLKDLTVDYLYGRQAAMGRVYRFLGVPIEDHPPNRRKATHDSLCAAVANYDDLCAALYMCQDLRWMFDDWRTGCKCGKLAASTWEEGEAFCDMEQPVPGADL